MRFAAPWDTQLKLSSAIIAGVLALVALALLAVARADGDPGALAIAAGSAGLLGGVVLLSWLYAPVGYELAGGEVRILRRVRPLAFPLTRIRAAGPLPSLLGRAVRLGGSGGLFGWYGTHWSRALGALRAYATRTRDLVQLDTPEGRWVLSPGDPERFLAEVLARAPGAALVPAEGPHARHPVPRGHLVRLVGGVGGVLVLIVVGVVATFAWAPTGVAVEGEAVTISRAHVDPVRLPLTAIRSAEVVGRARVGRVRKVTGFAAPGGAVWGKYRSERLGDFRLYASRRGPWVLLETSEGPVVVTPEEPDRFVAEVLRSSGRGPQGP